MRGRIESISPHIFLGGKFVALLGRFPLLLANIAACESLIPSQGQGFAQKMQTLFKPMAACLSPKANLMVIPVQIVEILGPAEQGLSRPYLCRGEDDALYYVKGRNTDRHSLWSEWACGHLGRELGLPIPEFCVVEVSAELIAETQPAWCELGVGLAFGSRQHPRTSWFERSFTSRVPDKLKRDLLVFDWWVRNGDRLTGNPNLLWDGSAGSMIVIDHNRAFDEDFDSSFFCQHHIFADVVPTIIDDLVVRAEYAGRLANLLAVFDSACDNAPEEWGWANVERDVPSNFNRSAARAHLARCSTPDFWRMV